MMRIWLTSKHIVIPIRPIGLLNGGKIAAPFSTLLILNVSIGFKTTAFRYSTGFLSVQGHPWSRRRTDGFSGTFGRYFHHRLSILKCSWLSDRPQWAHVSRRWYVYLLKRLHAVNLWQSRCPSQTVQAKPSPLESSLYSHWPREEIRPKGFHWVHF